MNLINAVSQYLIQAHRTARIGKFIRVVIFLSVVLPVILIACISYLKTSGDLTESTLSRRQSVADLSARILKEKLDNLLRIGVSLASRVQFRRFIEAGQWNDAIKILESVPKDFPFIERLFLADPSGTETADMPSLAGAVGKNFAYRDWYQGVSKEWKPYVSEIYQRAAEPKYNVVAAAIPIKSENQTLIGILVLQVRSEILLQWVGEIDAGNSGFAYVVDRKGHLAAHPKFPSQGNIVDFSSVPAVQKVLAGKSAVEVLYNPIEKEERLSAYKPVEEYGWGVIVQQPVHAAFALRREHLSRTLIIYSLILLLNCSLAFLILFILQTVDNFRQREKTFLESIGDGVFAIGHHFMITLWNRAAYEITGWRTEEVLGKPFRNFIKFIRESDRSECVAFIEEAVTTGKVKNLENGVVLITKDGREVPVGDSAAPVFDPKGKVTGAIVVFRDVSYQKKVQEALRKAHDELEVRVQERTEQLKEAQQHLVQQERLRALGEMASGIAHDFNNALSPILGYSEIMLDGADVLEDKTKSKEYLKIMNTAARDAAKVVGRLREFYRPRETNEAFHLLDVNQFVEQAVTLTQPKWKTQAMTKGIAIEVKTRLEEVPRIEGNEAELREVLTNLIFNAVDAMPQGGTITLHTYHEKDQVILEVSDTGTGMSEEVHRRCLEPFFTTKKDQGTGLGLSMVYGIIQRHGGTIDIESKAGKGTDFFIHLPIAKQNQIKELPETQQFSSGVLRILLVDDDSTVRGVIAQYLKRDGHTVEVAVNGLEGLNQFNAERFDLIITDRAMPEMTGEQLAVRIKQMAPRKPVILLSGTAALTNSAGENPEGVDAVISKPVTIEELRRVISKVLQNSSPK